MSFLDTPPLDYRDPKVQRLHDLFSKSYADRITAKNLALMAGLSPEILSTSADNMSQFWWQTMESALDAGLLRRLVETAAADSSKAAFRPQFDAILELTDITPISDGRAGSARSRTTHEPEVKPVSQTDTVSEQGSIAVAHMSSRFQNIGNNNAIAIGPYSRAQVGQLQVQPAPEKSTNIEVRTMLAIFTNSATIFDIERMNEAHSIYKSMVPGRLRAEVLPVCPIERLSQKLEASKPQLLHLVGMGDAEGLRFAHTNTLVSWVQLNEAITTSQARFECITISAAFSIMRASDLRLCAKYVIAAMPEHTAAVAATFAQAFYTAIGQGENTPQAYELGRRQVQQVYSVRDIFILL